MQPLAGLGPFDTIFCRNLLIYFDEEARKRLSEQCYQLLHPGGWLILGAAENLYGISDKFGALRLGETQVYCKLPS
jgi:chemotaxis protein methyltransferase CheR